MLTAWVREIEREVRQFGGELPVDAFLPELTAGHLEAGTRMGEPAVESLPEELVPPPAPPKPPAPPAPHPKKAKKASPDAGSTQPQSREALQKEIEEFMNRDPSAAAAEDEDDFSEFLSNSIDPNLDD